MVMYLLRNRILNLPAEMDILIDPFLLIIGIFPILYFFSFRPQLQSMRKLVRIDRRLKKRNTLLEDVLNGVHEGIGVVDANENIVFCNQVYARIFDETPRSIVGRNMGEFIDNETHSFILQQTGKRKKGKIPTYEIPIVTAKGTSKYIRVSVSPRLDRNGSYKGAFGVITDITEQKLVEDTLRESETKFKSIVEKANEAVITIDNSGKIIFWNPAAEKIFGYTIEEAVGQKIAMIVPGSLRQSHMDGMRRFVETGQSKIMGKTVEVPGLKKDGSEIPLELSLVSWKNGEELFISSIIRDVTERREAEEALKDSEERYRVLFEKSNEGILVADIGTKELLYANPAMCKMLGYTEDELKQMLVSDIHPGESLGKTMSEFEACARGEKDLVPNIPCIQKNGEIFYNNVTTAQINFGSRDCIVCFFTDITELIRIEGIKDEFVSTVSHELRTPLTSIYGSLSLINKGLVGDLPDQVKHLIEIAGRNTERLKCLVDDILDIEKLESGKMEFIMAPLKLAPLVERSIVENGSFGKQFNVDFVMDDILPDIEVNVDSNRLAQVMSNLLSNAAKVSPPGSPVEISVSRYNGSARVSVTDHGPGIPEEFRDRIFQKFTQAESIFERETKGTGLGLSIAKAIVEEHGGKIGFETELDVGTTFYFELPEWAGTDDDDQ